MLLLNPTKDRPAHADDRFNEIVRRTIDFFEGRGKRRLKEDDRERTWYADFLEFQKREKVFATLLTPPEYGDGTSRWDTSQIAAYSEVLAFYGLCYWYTWQVTILGLGPIWQSENEAMKRRAGALLLDGGIFAFGLSEKEHGADIYATEMALAPQADGSFRARGSKYYIGNGNEAALVSTLGKLTDSGEFVFFAVSTKHPSYRFVKNTVNSQSCVACFSLEDYPVPATDLLERGQKAWDAALNTVNIGKYNLGWGAIGMSTHAFYEAVHHAAHRRLYGHAVTDFPHVRQLLVDAWARLVAMKLFALRAADYMRTASLEDRRYLLYNPIVKMKVTTEGERVVNRLWDVIAAKGFEKDTIFEMVARDIRALPKLEGTVHVNTALIVKFMAGYFMNQAELPAVPKRADAAHDAFLFRQGPAKGLGAIRFHDYHLAYGSVDGPNARLFLEQVEAFRTFGLTATPDAQQQKDIDFLLTVGELFTLVAYGQLIIESARIHEVEGDVLEQIFDFLVRDFSACALELYSKPSSTPAQQELCLGMIRRPAAAPERFGRIWSRHVISQQDAYEMKE